jgi:glycosyltransferase involved in cell wall biosynthesis
MKHELSILIPVYNDDCTRLATQLSRQAEAIEGLTYEILAADDCSPDREAVAPNHAVNELPNGRYIERKQNVGSAANRNLLARESLYEWLLFIDCDQDILDDNFLLRYLTDNDDADVIMGGIAIGGDEQALRTNLRYRYEKQSEPLHTAANRSQRPYQSFRSCNFLIRRETLLGCPFDERFQKSGYEDVLLGKQLKAAHAVMRHIDNPVTMTRYEDNPDYMNKVERSLRTLHTFRADLKGYSRLLTMADGIHLGVVRRLLTLCFRLFGPLVRRRLCGPHPNLRLFQLYRLGYYLELRVKN